MLIQFSKSKFIIASAVVAVIFLAMISLFSCTKNADPEIGPEKPKPSKYSSEVIYKWMNLQLRLMKNATGIPNHAFARQFAYSGIAAMEAIEPGLNGSAEWTDKWNGLTNLPVPMHIKEYYYPENVNAALASMNRYMFPNATAADKAAIDSLENSLKADFILSQPFESVQTSEMFGKDVALAVFNWSEEDGYKLANGAYVPPVGPGLWKPTPPAFAAPATPFYGNNRPVFTGSTANTQMPAPIIYSEEPGTPFYEMAKEVFDASKTLTDDQKAMAAFWRDIPGVSSPGHWLSIAQQVIHYSNTDLSKAALTYALTGAAVNDALISCFKTKYTYNLVRPVTYIREVMGQSTWSPYLGTPAHPEYCSAHSSLSAAAAAVLEKLYGNPGSFTDHTYDYLGFAARTYPSYSAIAVEAGNSRFFAGIHYRPSIEAGIIQGKKVAENIFK